MLKSILEFFTGHKETDWSQDDKESCVQLLVLIMYIDNSLSDEEDQMIHRQIALFDWKGVHNEDYFLHETIRAVRELGKSPESIIAFIEKAAAKISEPEIKTKIISLCKHLSEADGTVNQREKEVIAIIEKTLS